jgi:amino acid adenylation domain-containing protein
LTEEHSMSQLSGSSTALKQPPAPGRSPAGSGPDLVTELLSRAWTSAADRVAIESDDVTLSYAELHGRVTELAAVLAGFGLGPESRVIVLLDRSIEQVICLLAVAFAGDAHLAVDPGDPDDRVRFMVADSAPQLILTSADHVSRFGTPACPVLVAEDLTAARDERAARAEVRLSADSPVYAVYTSGSTGRPKASLIQHRALASRIRWLQRTYQLTPEDRVLYQTACGFDVSLAEVYWPLASGARLMIAAPGAHRDPEYLADAVVKRGVTVLHFVPSLLEMFLDGRPDTETYPGLRLLLAAGEALSPQLVRRFYQRSRAALHNLYGPSECTIYATAWECPRDPDLDRVLIGSALDDTELRVMDERCQPVPEGTAGELCIGGAGLAREYIGRPGLTAERFFPHPSGRPGERLYRSGDLVRALPGGVIEYLGRLDSQVKVRGYRVELGEVERAAQAVTGVSRAAVIAEGSGGHTRLALFYVPQRPDEPGPAELRNALRLTLPGYMVPSLIRSAAALPLNPSGKVDRVALAGLAARVANADPAADGPGSPDSPVRAPAAVVTDVWCRVLRVRQVEDEQDFFDDLGGDSLTALQMTQQLGQRLGVTIPLRLLYRRPRFAGFVREVVALVTRPAGGS